MVTAAAIAIAIAIGTVNGILLAEMMFGGRSAPSRLLTRWADAVVGRWSR